jgi:hypothetical protein
VIVSIMQPAYLPWLGYFHRIGVSDLQIVLDHVEIDRNSKTKFANRNKVRTKDGWVWLTVPLKTKGEFGNLQINRLGISDDERWAQKHWQTIRHNYAKAPYFAQHAAFFEGIYNRRWDRLVDITREITAYLLAVFGISTPVRWSSTMDVAGTKDELILNLCRAVGATVYMSGPFGRDYLHEERFQAAGIKVVYHDYVHPTYPQVFPGFEPAMAAIDLLFNCGPKSREILLTGQDQV